MQRNIAINYFQYFNLENLHLWRHINKYVSFCCCYCGWVVLSEVCTLATTRSCTTSDFMIIYKFEFRFKELFLIKDWIYVLNKNGRVFNEVI